MKLRCEWLWRVLPVPVVVLDRMPGRLLGLSMGLFVVMHREVADDRPMVLHELTHCRQFWRAGLLLHMLRYYLSRNYRLRCEVEAFRAELDACDPALHPHRLQEATRALASGYHLGLDLSTCRRLLTCSHPFVSFWPTSPQGALGPPNSSNAVIGRSNGSTRR